MFDNNMDNENLKNDDEAKKVKAKLPVSFKYPKVYIEKYMSKELCLEEAYAQCSSELLKFRMTPCRESEYIKNLEFQEKYLSSIVITRYMESKGYKLVDSNPQDVHWEKKGNY